VSLFERVLGPVDLAGVKAAYMSHLELVTGFTQSWCGGSFSFERVELRRIN
jgi:hypothetical protein